VDYEENESPFYSDESGSSDSQVMTYSTYYPHSHSSKPCHHRHDLTVNTVQDTVAAAAADAADADVLASAASHAWQRAKQLIARLAAADAAATAELITELETTLQHMDQAQLAADTVIDHRWEQFDGPSSSLVQEILANYIDPALQLVSGSDYDPQEDSAAQQQQQQQEQDDIIIVDDGSNGAFPYDQQHFDPMEFFSTKPARLPADPAPGSAHAAGFLAGIPDEDDIGLLILPEDNAANNLALFGVRSPEEVAAIGAAAAPGAQYSADDSVSVWHSSRLEWLSAAPFQPLDTEKAAAVLIVVATLMVFAAFLINLIDLRATVHAAAAGAAAAAHASGANSSSSSGYIVAVPAGAMPLRTRKATGFSSCSAVAAVAAAAAAAAGAAMGVQQQGSGLGHDASELSRPLLQDSGDENDLEAAAVQAQPSSGLPPTLQKFYNPLHYQQLPDAE